MFRQILQNSQENTKKEIPAQMFSCEFCEISQNIFFKDPLDGCFSINTSSVYYLTMTFYLFKNNITHIILADNFFGLICRLGTTVSSVFQAHSPKPIFNPCQTSPSELFFAKTVLSQKKLHCDVRPGSKYASVSSH